MSLVGLLNQCTKKMKKREDSSISKEESTNVMNYLMTLSASGKNSPLIFERNIFFVSYSCHAY